MDNTCKFCGKTYMFELTDSVTIDLTSVDYYPRYFKEPICLECAEKLVELLDKHFPRLNLEDELGPYF